MKRYVYIIVEECVDMTLILGAVSSERKAIKICKELEDQNKSPLSEFGYVKKQLNKAERY